MAGTGGSDPGWPQGQVCFPVERDVAALLSELAGVGAPDEDLASRAGAMVVARLTQLYPGIVTGVVEDVLRPGTVPPPGHFGPVPGGTAVAGQEPDASGTPADEAPGPLPQERALAGTGTADPAGSGKLAEWAPSTRLLSMIDAYARGVAGYVEAVAAHLDAVSLELGAARPGEGHGRAGAREQAARRVAEAGATLDDALASLASELELPVPADGLMPSEITGSELGGAHPGPDADGAGPLAGGQLLARAAALLGPAAEAWGRDDAAKQLRARQHKALTRVAGLLAHGDSDAAQELADEIGPSHGFLGHGLAGGMLSSPGYNFTQVLHTYPEAERPAILEEMVRVFRGKVLGPDAQVQLPQAEAEQFAAEWPAIERKLRKIIAVAPGSRGWHPLVPSHPVGKHPDFGSKQNYLGISSDDRSTEHLARHLLGWARAKPRRRQEGEVARQVEGSQEVNLLLAVLLRRAAEKIDVISDDHPGVLQELTTSLINGEPWEFGYARYFHDSNTTLAERGLGYLVSDVWSSTNPDRFYGVASQPERFGFRDKMTALHDIADYFSDRQKTAGTGIRPPLTPQMVQVTTQVDEHGIRAAAESAYITRIFLRHDEKMYSALWEDDPWVRLARSNGIPIWNGPSGTTASMVAFANWVNASHNELAAMAWGMAAFWRLHYDHTFSSSHTVHEVMDIASNFDLPYSLHNPYATLADASVRAVITEARDAAAAFRSALDGAGGTGSLTEPLATRVRSVLDRAAQLDAEPWISGFVSFSAINPADIEAVRNLDNLTLDLYTAESDLADIAGQHEPADARHPAVFTAITADAMAAGIQRVLSGQGPQLGQPALGRLRGIWEASWEQDGRQEAGQQAHSAVQQAGAGPAPGRGRPGGESRGPVAAPGADAVTAQRARAIADEWRDSSRLGLLIRRSPGVTAIDTALEQWVTAVRAAPGDLAADEAGREAVDDALVRWLAGKQSSGRADAASDLQRALAEERHRIDDESGYAQASDLLRDLHQSARAPDAQSASLGPLGPDLFGLREPVAVPAFLRERGHPEGTPYAYSRISADKLVHFLHLLDMLHDPVAAEMDPRRWTVQRGAYSWSSKRPTRHWALSEKGPLLRSDTVEVPKLMQATWFGGTLRPTGPSAGAWHRFRAAAKALDGQATFVLFTDRPRAALTAVRELDAAPDLDPGQSDFHLAQWAREGRIKLVNLFEVIAAFEADSPLLPLIQTELAKQSPKGYAAASDIARVFLHKFGGLYTDPDNEIRGLHGLRQMGTGQVRDTFAIGEAGTGELSNSVMALTRDHPIADMEERLLLDNYRLTQPELINRFDAHYHAGERTRRHSVILRSGPAVLARAIEAAGYERDSAPKFRGVIVNADLSWLETGDGIRPARRWTKRETLDFAQKVIHTMARSLHYRQGDLHLTRINDAVQTHGNPDLIWNAALSFLAERQHLRRMLRSITYTEAEEPDDTSESRTWELVHELLPEPAASLLQPSRTGPTLGGGQPWLGEQPVAARLDGAPAQGTRHAPVPLRASLAGSAAVSQPAGAALTPGTGHPAVFTAITGDAMAAGMQRVLSGQKPQPSQTTLDRLRGIWEASWEQDGRQEASQQAPGYTRSTTSRPAAVSVPGRDQNGVPREFLILGLSAAAPGTNDRLQPLGELGMEAAPGSDALAGQIADAFRKHFGVPSGRLPDEFDVQVDVSESLGQATAVLATVSKAAEQLGHYVKLKLHRGVDPVKICPPLP